MKTQRRKNSKGKGSKGKKKTSIKKKKQKTALGGKIAEKDSGFQPKENKSEKRGRQVRVSNTKAKHLHKK